MIPALPKHIHNRFRIVAPDLIGFGRSPCPDELLYTIETHIESLEHALIEQRNLHHIHLVGHSFGSIVSLAFAARHLDRIRSIQLCAIPYFESREDALRTWKMAPTSNAFLIRYPYIARLLCFLFCRHNEFWSNFLLPFLQENTPICKLEMMGGW